MFDYQRVSSKNDEHGMNMVDLAIFHWENDDHQWMEWGY